MRVRSALAMMASLAIISCAPAVEETAAEPEGIETGSESGDADGNNLPESFAETAWISRSEDGARYTTFFDADGSYRELRNGDPRQTGEWSFAEGPEGKQVCVQPDAEAGVKSCWRPDSIEDGKLLVSGPEGKRVALQRADYSAPGAEDAAVQ